MTLFAPLRLILFLKIHNKLLNKMNQNEKPFQLLAWIATAILILAALLASFVPALEYHHWAFIIANSLWVIVGFLWREMSLIVLNAGLTIIYVFGLIL
tara:strand:+ start:35 stop:328 length:294 start_codon:yes stop_codon:yes gene_type:complete